MGCTKVSEGCANCYMYRMLPAYGKDPRNLYKSKVETIEKNLTKWEPSKIFANSMSDTFHPAITDQQLDDMFYTMAKYDKHTFIVLTKRIERAVEYFKKVKIPDNVWMGTSVELDKYVSRIDELRKIDAKVRFVSFEPLLGLIHPNLEGIHWAIVGGESGNNVQKPRPMDIKWVDAIKMSCDMFKVKFFFKQNGGVSKCACHKSYGCCLYKDKVWHEFPGSVTL